ncbi:hypothetical protein QBK93_33880 [Rhizobium leguminosarum]|uniref:hypothetical protein n=1 Tax=Rhizobium leguminosarum TaxID=384 RepID=UPI0024A88424|nr:hypothetical protein [Rhizobium leguminosarum]MDI5929606.1 hypothetical protein [Rhizobium leguminosarum]
MPITTNPSWLAADYRAALEAWRATAPKTDSEIFGSSRQKAPRHAEKARLYRNILTFRSPPSGEPLESNWRTLPANDNTPPTDFTSERRIETVPSEEEIVAAVENFDEIAKFEVRREARLADGKFTHVPRRSLNWPVDGDFEIGVDADGKRVVVRLGKYHFSNGRHQERAYRVSPDGGVEPYSARLPAGAMRYTTEEQATVKGSAHQAHAREANLRIADIFGFHELYEPAPSRRKKRTGRNYTRDEAVAMLEQAKANTPVMPTVRKLPDGLPLVTKDLASIFMSLQKRPSGRGHLHAWEDFATRLDAKAAWQRVIAELPAGTIEVLEAALDAKSMADVGRIAVGASDSYAERAGKAALEAANDNLTAAMRKIAA